ncbi:uncharacterized protein LOC106761962 isoform X2 [Vigna radiata var. radiata]|uniref:Uncharacterized protein LOC106761962 isoform X2 n=1 Tax=Vigna radiata var. radiata TaxID=3916 RepID=A0A3Q0F2G4_VIGRR|nr:uncharacterized protein LOC106761962 isoform X2 [Vigna radiata var. radiata]
MGAACCVAARDKTIQSGSTSDILHRNVRCSPTWSFRWDHRGRVAGEDISINWFSDGISRNDGSENKNESAYVSEDGSPLQNYQRKRFQQSPISEATAVRGRNSTSDQSFSGTVSTDMSVEQVNGLVESSTISCPSPTKPSLPSTSLSTSPLASLCHIPPSNLTPVRWPCHSPGYQLSQQASDSRIPAVKSSSSFSLSEERPVFPSWNNDVGMRGGSSDGWSIPGFSELMGTPHKERWSFDSESFGFNRERLVRSSSWFSASSVDLQSCGICSKLLAEKSSWSTQKIIATCPVCTFGEKQTMKLSAKALKAEMDLKARNNKSKNRNVDSDIDDDSVVFDGFKGKCPRNDSSSSRRSSFGKPFLRRHFSFGSKGPRSMLDNHPTRKKGFFWAKSSKE